MSIFEFVFETKEHNKRGNSQYIRTKHIEFRQNQSIKPAVKLLNIKDLLGMKSAMSFKDQMPKKSLSLGFGRICIQKTT